MGISIASGAGVRFRIESTGKLLKKPLLWLLRVGVRQDSGQQNKTSKRKTK
jgi:hypothetical protein